MGRKFPVVWRVKLPEGGVELANPSNVERGVADAVVVASVIYDEDSRTHQFWSTGGSGEPLDAFEVFRAWVTLGYDLMGNPDLGQQERLVARAAFESGRERVTWRRAIEMRGREGSAAVAGKIAAVIAEAADRDARGRAVSGDVRDSGLALADYAVRDMANPPAPIWATALLFVAKNGLGNLIR